MKMKRPTLNEVAEKTGLSIYTVSRALNDAKGVSVDSRKKVLEAAAAIGYVPNKAARDLRSQAPGPVLVLTASTSNYYYIDMIEGIQAGLSEAGHVVRFVDIAPSGRFDPSVENAVVQEAMQSRAAGVISTLTLSVDNYDRMTEWGVPTVFVDSNAPASKYGAASVTTDNLDAASQVGDHFAWHGYTTWVLLIYPHLWSTRAFREEGLRASADAHNANLIVLETDNDPVSAKRVFQSFLRDKHNEQPFALVAGNNPLLQGALGALKDCGLAVPDDVPIIAFDEFPWAPLLASPVTVINEDSRSIGEMAARKLTSIIARRGSGSDNATPARYLETDQEEVKAELLIRQSCGCN